MMTHHILILPLNKTKKPHACKWLGTEAGPLALDALRTGNWVVVLKNLEIFQLVSGECNFLKKYWGFIIVVIITWPSEKPSQKKTLIKISSMVSQFSTNKRTISVFCCYLFAVFNDCWPTTPSFSSNSYTKLWYKYQTITLIPAYP